MLDPKGIPSLWGQAFVEPLGVYASMCSWTTTYMDMHRVHGNNDMSTIYNTCTFVQTHIQAHTHIHSMDTSIPHTKFPSRWGQAFVEPLGVYVSMCLCISYMLTHCTL